MKLSPSEIKKEIERVRSNNYNQFVKKVTLKDIRGFKEESVEFKAPVTALVGTNGGGKSTILGAVALAYKSIKPGQFFPKAFVGDESMANWAVEIEFIDKPMQKEKTVTRTARFSSSKWRRDDFPDRHVEYVEIQRTVPAGELSKFRKFLSGDKQKYSESPLNIDTIKFATAVLDKDLSHYKTVYETVRPEIKMYVGATSSAIGYSQFHFGAGEASVIETIDRIENSPDNALILIEEVENGLHPVAVRLFIQYLQSAASRKRLQIVFTTHSQEAVDELPAESVWASINKRTWNGKLSIESLRAINGTITDTHAVYVEDDFVKEWANQAIGRYGDGLGATTRVFSAGGYPNVIKVSQFHNDNPMLSVPSVALVDGDIYDPTKDKELPDHARYLGDGYPEETVFNYIYTNRLALASKIRQRCLLSQFNEAEIVQSIDSVKRSQCDCHIIFSELSEKLNFVSALHIQAGMIDLFNEGNPEFWEPIINFIKEKSKPN